MDIVIRGIKVTDMRAIEWLPNSLTVQIETQHLVQGTYFLRITDHSTAIKTFKIIKH